jgi:hypothetical protein
LCLVDDGGLTRVAASVVGEAVVVAALHQLPADQLLGDGVEAASREVLLEDPLHDRRRRRVRFEPMQPLAVGSLAWVAVRPSIRAAVAVGGRPPRKRPSLRAWAATAERTRILIRLRSPWVRRRTR